MRVEDLELRSLKVLAVMLEERHVGRAAQRLGVGQPTVSYHLGLLRGAFGDALFVRDGRGVRPTDRALSLEGGLRALQLAMSTLAARERFDPATAERELRVASLDYERVVLLAEVVADVAAVSPRCRLALVARGSDDLERLADARLDLVIGPRRDDARSGYRRRLLFHDQLSCVVRRGHPLASSRRPTLQRWASFPHVTVIVDDIAGSPVDRYLQARGLRRRVIARVAGFQAAQEIVARTDAVALLPASLARAQRSDGLVVLRAPLAPPTFGIYAMWHDRAHSDPLHSWLRGRVAEIARRIEAT